MEDLVFDFYATKANGRGYEKYAFNGHELPHSITKKSRG
jgi:hypothetical protein